jgi:integrase
VGRSLARFARAQALDRWFLPLDDCACQTGLWTEAREPTRSRGHCRFQQNPARPRTFSFNARETLARAGRMLAGCRLLSLLRVEPGPGVASGAQAPAGRKEAAYFENDELPRLFTQLNDTSSRTLCLLALKTGMRQGELLGLRWSDIDLKQAVVRVRRATPEARWTPRRTVSVGTST